MHSCSPRCRLSLSVSWLTVRRLRSAGLPLATCVLFFVPVINFVFFAILLLIPSQHRGLAPPLLPGERPWLPASAKGSALLATVLVGVFGTGECLSFHLRVAKLRLGVVRGPSFRHGTGGGAYLWCLAEKKPAELHAGLDAAGRLNGYCPAGPGGGRGHLSGDGSSCGPGTCVAGRNGRVFHPSQPRGATSVACHVPGPGRSASHHGLRKTSGRGFSSIFGDNVGCHRCARREDMA